MTPIERIFDILQAKGGADYGSERVTQLQHALQSAALAEAAGAPSALVAAALLHDFGHMIHDLGRNPAARGLDDRHEVRGRDWLGQWFAEDVTGPVRLHVDAKRYLCAVDPGYFGTLSPASVRSLELQGGPFPADLAKSFIGLPHAAAAVELRRWDDCAKESGRPTPDLPHFRRHLEASLRPA